MIDAVARLFGKERDPIYGGWVRRGWVAERQGLMDEQVRRYEAGEPSGSCLDCDLPIKAHPMPARMWRSDPSFCAVAWASEPERGD